VIAHKQGPTPTGHQIHGGFWRAAYDLEHNGHLCEARDKKESPHGRSNTAASAILAAQHVKALTKEFPINLKRTIAMAHSAGGHLAPPEIARRYTNAVLKAGDKAKLDLLPGGHFPPAEFQTSNESDTSHASVIAFFEGSNRASS